MKVTGASEHVAHLKRMSGQEMVAKVGQALFVAGDMIKVEAQISLTRGAVSGRNHVPSAPGTPPHQDTGGLGNNIENVQTGPLKVQVSSNARYAAVQEFGGSINHPGGTSFIPTNEGAIFLSNEAANRLGAQGFELPRTRPHLITLPARPYMRPAAQTKRAEVSKLLAKAIDYVNARSDTTRAGGFTIGTAARRGA